MNGENVGWKEQISTNYNIFKELICTENMEILRCTNRKSNFNVFALVDPVE